jgi:hypothetical protein
VAWEPNATAARAECRAAAAAAVVGLWQEEGALFANGTGRDTLRAAAAGLAASSEYAQVKPPPSPPVQSGHVSSIPPY